MAPRGDHMTIRTFCVSMLLLTIDGRAQTQAPMAPQPAPAGLSCTELASAIRAVMSNDARVKDWPNLARYREANRTVAESATRVVFMGDSITDSWQQPRFGGFFPGKPYADRGISGQTTPQMLARFRADVIDLHPDVVVILAGTNDIAGNTGPLTNEETEGNLASMSELAQAHHIKVVLASVTPVSAAHVPSPTAVPETTQRPPARIQAINAWLKAYADAHGHIYLDYFTAMADLDGLLRADLSADDLHPNAKGYLIMAPLAEAAIQTALKAPSPRL
jgi:lysophospholipase L1-like esterase